MPQVISLVKWQRFNLIYMLLFYLFFCCCCFLCEHFNLRWRFWHQWTITHPERSPTPFSTSPFFFFFFFFFFYGFKAVVLVLFILNLAARYGAFFFWFGPVEFLLVFRGSLWSPQWGKREIFQVCAISHILSTFPLYVICTLRKQAYSNRLKILPPKKWKFSEKKILIFFIFLLKT